jgi:competence protein ComEA
MGLKRYLAVAALGVLLATPVVGQTTSPSTSTSRPAATPPSTTMPSKAAPAPGTTSQSRETPSSQEKSGPIDINSASAQELDKLPGIGPARAQAIVANRPYNGKDDLAQRKILPQSVYDQIKDKIIARQGSAKESAGSAGAAKSR